MLISDPLESLPHLMTTIQSCSKMSGYKINWEKSEAMPISVMSFKFSVIFQLQMGVERYVIFGYKAMPEH